MLVFRSLASGSSGNAYLLRTDKAAILFEAGIRLSTLRKHLMAEGVDPSQLSAILISHEHRDHCLAAADAAREWGAPLRTNEHVLRAAGLHGLRQSTVLPVGQNVTIGDVEVRTFPVSHDASCPVGFFVRVHDRSILIATDLGEPTDALNEAVGLADLVVIEANHDTEMLHSGRYPYPLRRRVAGPTGHLSNTQTARILAESISRTDVDVWLAHLSKENNMPRLAVKTVSLHMRAVGLEEVSIAVAQRDRPSLRWAGLPRPRQLSLFPDS